MAAMTHTLRVEVETWPPSELDVADKPHHLGCAVIWPATTADDGPGCVIRVVARDDLTPERRAQFDAWAAERIARCLNHGPELDGWQTRSDGGIQAYCAEVWLPDPTVESDEAAEHERAVEERLRREREKDQGDPETQ